MLFLEKVDIFLTSYELIQIKNTPDEILISIFFVLSLSRPSFGSIAYDFSSQLVIKIPKLYLLYYRTVYTDSTL